MPESRRFPRIKMRNVLIYVGIFLGIVLIPKIFDMITDYYWFQELGLTSLFKKSFLTGLGLGAGGAVLTLAILLINLYAAREISHRPFVIIEPDATVHAPLPIPILSEIKLILHIALVFFAFLIAYFVGTWAAGEWDTLLKFLHGVSFGQVDPLFKRDISFYVFQLPFYRFIYQWLWAMMIFSFIFSSVIYLIESRIHIVGTKIRIAESARLHLSLIAGAFCFLVACYFQFKLFDLLQIQRPLAPGAGFADVNAYLPALKILRFIGLVCALLLWVSPWFVRIRMVLGAVILLVAGTLIAGIYRETVQKFEVAPNEIAKETPYIKMAIQHTRDAYGLSGIQELEFDPKENLTTELLRKNDLTVKNIRLWDHRPLLTTFSQLQEIRTYYDFLDADNDRYWIDGEYRQVMLSVRELVAEHLPSRIWINEHLTYTHGYGICLGPVNRISPEGLPEFFIKDIPPVSTTHLKVTRPEIYFGEAQANYAIVNTGSKEFNYPSGEENVYTAYEGTGGVPVKNFWRRIMFALRFSEMKILLSGDIRPESRFIYYRSVKDRVARCAPFLSFDSDPYIVISDEGKLFWILDGYSTTDCYPYSETIGDMNYIRNSVKATIDAYNGTVALYISDPTDPVIRTYAKIFPGLFRPMEAMPQDLRSHIRYPQALMNLQARIYATYHMNDAQVFYNKEDLWKIPIRNLGGRTDPMEPYYTITKLSGIGDKEEFILMTPFTPAKKENMIAWMAARCDAPNYGKLLVYNFPKQKLVFGPQQIESRIDQDPEISKQLTLWDQGGSRVLRGSLLVIPIEQSLLYIQPLYLEASNGGLPELKRIIVAYENSIAMEENLESCLAKIFTGRAVSSVLKSEERSTPVENSTLIRKAREHFENAQRAQRQGDWAQYGEEMKKLEQTLKSLSK